MFGLAAFSSAAFGGEGATDAKVTPSSVEGTTAVGSVTVTGTCLVVEDGVSSLVAHGQVTTQLLQIVVPTSATGTGQIGSSSVTADANVSVTGPSAATGSIGTVDAVSVVEVTGVSARGNVADVVGFSAKADAAISTDQSKFGGSSLELDGSGDRIQSDDITLGTDDYTWETFAYFNNFSSTQCIWDAGENVGASQNPVVYITQTNLQLSYAGGTYINQPHGMSAGGWHHIAIVRDGTQLEAFIDGTSIGTATYSGGSGATNHVLGGNFAGTFTMDGYLDESRLTSRVIYTGNFTPPTQAFAGDTSDIWLLHYDGADGSTDIVNSAPGEPNTTVTGTAVIEPTGIEDTGSVGTPAILLTQLIVPSSLEATGSVNAPSITGDSNITLTSVVGTATLGTAVAGAGAVVSVTGQSATGSEGTVTPFAGATGTPSGVTCSGELGNPSLSGTAVVLLTGTSGTGEIGKARIWEKIAPTPGATWGDITPSSTATWNEVAA